VKNQHDGFALNSDGDESKPTELKAAPNPVRDVVTLFLSSGEADAGDILWFNELGIQVKRSYVEWKRGGETIEMDVSDLPAGTYLVRSSVKTVMRLLK
jgi:hypothetical protein